MVADNPQGPSANDKSNIPVDIDLEKFKQLLEEMVRNAGPNTVIMADPQIIEKLENEDNSLLVKIPRKPVKELLVETFDRRKIAALEIVDKIPRVLDESRPSIQQLYDEIKECILFGVNGAAITLCGVLVEYVLKYVTYHWDIQERSVLFNSQRWDCTVEGTQLGGAIAQAKSLGIITEDEMVVLNKFKDEVRNPYSHYNIRKLVKDISFSGPRVDAIKETVETVETVVGEDPAFFSIAKKWRDDKFIITIFYQTYNYTKILLFRLNAHWNIKG
ncbi:MAG: hypothetical protein KKG02_11470 [Candidatus Edwardsbacteria bacterium]|nr:hypothetical protein [Candidatus Edwardsbacteria bacterium]MBU2595142.1 hypothetical protein [Candidatus Edwardsbacteria bacterium]